MDVVKLVKQLIAGNPSLKQKLVEQGIITEKDGDIVILKPEAFEVVDTKKATTNETNRENKGSNW